MNPGTLLRRAVAGGLTAVALGAAASPACADMLAYTVGKDVWVENADGSQRKQVTTDGSSGTYVTPSPNDAGDVAAIQLAGFSAGIHFWPADGSEKKVNMMPTRGVGSLMGPFGARLVPDSPSKLLAYTYGRYENWQGTQGPYLNVVPADAPGLPTAESGIPSPFIATPHGGRFVYTALDGRLYYGMGANSDPVLLSFKDDGIDIEHGEVSRDGSKLLLIASQGGSSGVLALARLNGPMPGQYGEDCIIATTGLAKRAAFSPDGDRAAWTDDAGLHVAKVDLATQSCAVSEKRTIAANGDYPAFSRHTMSAPAGDGGGGGTSDPGTKTAAPPAPPAPPVGGAKRGGSAGVPALSVRASTTSLRTVLRRGLTLRFAGLPAGRVPVVVRSGRRVLARRSVVASSAGEARLTLKLSPKQRRAFRGKKRATLSVTAGKTTRTISLR